MLKSANNRSNSENQLLSLEDIIPNSISSAYLRTKTQINDIAAQILEINAHRRSLANIFQIYNEIKLCQSLPGLSEFYTNQKISTAVKPINLHGLTIAGIDGGLIKKSLAGVDIIGYRACGAVFTYGESEITYSNYYPNKFPPIKLEASFIPYSLSEWEHISSQIRAVHELETAVHLLNDTHRKIDVLLMDGTFSESRTGSGSLTFSKDRLNQYNNFSKYFNLIRLLHNLAYEKGTTIGWIVKDSRSRYFNTFLRQLIPEITNQIPEILQFDIYSILESIWDQTLMSHLLLPKYRSFILPKSIETAESFDSIYNSSFSFYLKVVPFDVPLRVDFSLYPSKSENLGLVYDTAERLATIVFSLSKVHPSYSYPVPLIEADARARISTEEFQIILDSIHQKTMHCYETLNFRRSRNPFNFR